MAASYQSQSQNAGVNGANAVVAKPSGTVAGDLLIAVGVTSGTTILPPAGWTEHANSMGGQVPLWTRTAGGSEPADYTFTPSGGLLPYTGVVIVRVSGQSGIDAVSGHSVPGNIVLPSVTAAGADRLLMQVIAKASASSTWTPPGGVTERFDSLANSVNGAGGDQIVGSGATGTRTWTPTDTGAGAVGYMLAIAPAPTGQFTGTYLEAGSGFTGQTGPGLGSLTGTYDESGVFTGEGGPGEGSFTGGYAADGSGWSGQAPTGTPSGQFNSLYSFDGAGFTGESPAPPPPVVTPRFTPGGRNRFTARRGR